MNVLTAAWTWSGAPASADTARIGRGRCARCALEADLTPVREVVSKAFTGFDDWAEPAGRGLCGACSWGYSTPALRAVPHLVDRDSAGMRELTRAEAGQMLQVGPLDTGRALVVPLRPGRKHILPTAEWGRVAVDDAHLPWTEREAGLLGVVAGLRELGFGSRMLAEAAPPYTVLSGLPGSVWAQVMDDWARLAVWRVQAGPWLPLAVHLTTPIKESR